jgi:hypothetical protein
LVLRSIWVFNLVKAYYRDKKVVGCAVERFPSSCWQSLINDRLSKATRSLDAAPDDYGGAYDQCDLLLEFHSLLGLIWPSLV